MARDPLKAIRSYMRGRGWKPLQFQEEVWRAYLNGQGVLLHAPTGMGKTLAVWLGPLAEWMQEKGTRADPPPLRVLWITPLRALANDTLNALREPVDTLALPWTVAMRTGDVGAAAKARVRRTPPSALVTTPESLSLLLSYNDAAANFAHLRCIVVDEWHELLGSKRGVQTELCLARLRRLSPGVRTWGLSATIGNVEQAADVLAGETGSSRVVVADRTSRDIEIVSAIPESMGSFPWGGHTGLHLLPHVVDAIAKCASTLLFTNTRSQCEVWYRAIREARPEWAGQIGLHHGSLDREFRECVEQLLARGEMRCVVCTSSLDLGVDFAPVDQVIQVGSPKGVARLLQRAGRSGHRPNAASRILCVPAHAMELADYSAARVAVHRGTIEPRRPLARQMDVLVQHLVTIAAGEGFAADEMLREVRATHAYRNLGDDEWQWALQFITSGGPALGAYPDFHRVREAEGRFTLATDRFARMHRLAIGTITSDAAVSVKMANGALLGSIEESFIGRLRAGESFIFAGKVLELVRVNGMSASVRISKRKTGVIPRWMGGRMSLSTQLASGIRERLSVAEGGVTDPELAALEPILEAQRRLSTLPQYDQLLVETVHTREGHHIFFFPFAGRLVHEGLAMLVAYRLTRTRSITVSLFVNDLGFELLSSEPIQADEAEWRALLSPANIEEDIPSCANVVELARRRFRDIARIAGLIPQGFPGKHRSTKQFQVSSSLLYDVFSKYDPENLLLAQARRDVLKEELCVGTLRAVLEAAQGQRFTINELERISPLAFPLWSERWRGQVSGESWEDRVRRMSEHLQRAAGGRKLKQARAASPRQPNVNP